MRRVEMVNGNFTVESAPGKTTTILAQIPPGNARAEGEKTIDGVGWNQTLKCL